MVINSTHQYSFNTDDLTSKYLVKKNIIENTLKRYYVTAYLYKRTVDTLGSLNPGLGSFCFGLTGSLL